MKELIGWRKHWELGSANEPNAEQVWRENQAGKEHRNTVQTDSKNPENKINTPHLSVHANHTYANAHNFTYTRSLIQIHVSTRLIHVRHIGAHAQTPESIVSHFTD